jgi:3-demethoxyubiquinol 3-hydroxylase
MEMNRIEVPLASVRANDPRLLSATWIADLRTDHAGECGAVMIYRGILAATRDAGVRRFAQGHLATEAGHLDKIEPLLSRRQRSRLLPLWRIAGWLTGALPALLEACRSDEVMHRDEAGALFALGRQPPSPVLRIWVWLVGTGSRVAVKMCRRV